MLMGLVLGGRVVMGVSLSLVPAASGRVFRSPRSASVQRGQTGFLGAWILSSSWLPRFEECVEAQAGSSEEEK